MNRLFRSRIFNCHSKSSYVSLTNSNFPVLQAVRFSQRRLMLADTRSFSASNASHFSIDSAPITDADRPAMKQKRMSSRKRKPYSPSKAAVLGRQTQAVRDEMAEILKRLDDTNSQQIAHELQTLYLEMAMMKIGNGYKNIFKNIVRDALQHRFIKEKLESPADLMQFYFDVCTDTIESRTNNDWRTRLTHKDLKLFTLNATSAAKASRIDDANLYIEYLIRLVLSVFKQHKSTVVESPYQARQFEDEMELAQLAVTVFVDYISHAKEQVDFIQDCLLLLRPILLEKNRIDLRRKKRVKEEYWNALVWKAIEINDGQLALDFLHCYGCEHLIELDLFKTWLPVIRRLEGPEGVDKLLYSCILQQGNSVFPLTSVIAEVYPRTSHAANALKFLSVVTDAPRVPARGLSNSALAPMFNLLSTHTAMNEEELALAVKINRRLVQLCVDARNLGPQTVRRFLLAAMRLNDRDGILRLIDLLTGKTRKYYVENIFLVEPEPKLCGLVNFRDESLLTGPVRMVAVKALSKCGDFEAAFEMLAGFTSKIALPSTAFAFVQSITNNFSYEEQLEWLNRLEKVKETTENSFWSKDERKGYICSPIYGKLKLDGKHDEAEAFAEKHLDFDNPNIQSCLIRVFSELEMVEETLYHYKLWGKIWKNKRWEKPTKQLIVRRKVMELLAKRGELAEANKVFNTIRRELREFEKTSNDPEDDLGYSFMKELFGEAVINIGKYDTKLTQEIIALAIEVRGPVMGKYLRRMLSLHVVNEGEPNQ